MNENGNASVVTKDRKGPIVLGSISTVLGVLNMLTTAVIVFFYIVSIAENATSYSGDAVGAMVMVVAIFFGYHFLFLAGGVSTGFIGFFVGKKPHINGNGIQSIKGKKVSKIGLVLNLSAIGITIIFTILVIVLLSIFSTL